MNQKLPVVNFLAPLSVTHLFKLPLEKFAHFSTLIAKL
jgi:hypothetical protein